MTSMMMSGGRSSNLQHELYLQLGSDHVMPPSAKPGKSVQLVVPRGEQESGAQRVIFNYRPETPFTLGGGGC